MEYKGTLNLPQTTLEMRANATQKEPQTQEFWERANVYEKNLAQRDKANSFVLHDGPPYLSSGKIHVGTALNKILKDILIDMIYTQIVLFINPCVVIMRLMFRDMTDMVCPLKIRLLRILKAEEVR